MLRRILSYALISERCEQRQTGRLVFHIIDTLSTGLRVAARGDVLVIPHLDAVSRKSSGRSARKKHSLLRSSLDPASQRGVTLSVIPHPDAVSRKRSGKSVRQIHSFYVPLWTPRRSAG